MRGACPPLWIQTCLDAVASLSWVQTCLDAGASLP